MDLAVGEGKPSRAAEVGGAEASTGHFFEINVGPDLILRGMAIEIHVIEKGVLC